MQQFHQSKTNKTTVDPTVVGFFFFSSFVEAKEQKSFAVIVWIPREDFPQRCFLSPHRIMGRQPRVLSGYLKITPYLTFFLLSLWAIFSLIFN